MFKLTQMQKFMFTSANMKLGYATRPVYNICQANTSIIENVQAQQQADQVKQQAEQVQVQIQASELEEQAQQVQAQQQVQQQAEQVQAQQQAEQVQAEQVQIQQIPASKKKEAKPFTPFQKDKLFWCFFIILKGYDEYEINRSNSFSLEKQIKIEAVEKLKSIKEQLKDLKLKRTELEDELVNKQMITMKGLCALCLVHNVSITYVFGRKYCEILSGPASLAPATTTTSNNNNNKKGIIIQNEKKEDSLKWTSNELNDSNDFLTKLQEEYWLIENIQKPLKAPSAYTLPELQTICQKLLIETQCPEKEKAKTKTKLYEEILQHL
jgi:hypothetical protein